MNDIWDWIQNTELSFQIGATYWFPLLESIHVLGVAFLVGSIIVVDLRLLGYTALNHLFTSLHRELTRWTWIAFTVAITTGLGLFISRPGAYADNLAFQIKFGLLICAGLNLLVFKRYAYASVSTWDDAAAIPTPARIAGLVSLIIWAGVITAGRWVGHSM